MIKRQERENMERLVKDGAVILDGKKPQYLLERDAFIKLEIVEQIMENNKIANLSELDNACREYAKNHQ